MTLSFVYDMLLSRYILVDALYSSSSSVLPMDAILLPFHF